MAYPSAGRARNRYGAELENERSNSTGCRLVYAARAINFFLAFALAHSEGVNCLISVIFAEGRRLGVRRRRIGTSVGEFMPPSWQNLARQTRRGRSGAYGQTAVLHHAPRIGFDQIAGRNCRV
jgi:hypothetical protein